MTTIMIVDDEEPVRSLLTWLMTDAGFRAIVAPNGAEALALIEENRPDLVISDVMMPQLNGVELCRRLKSTVETRSIPVILMSAVEWRKAEEMSADAFVLKPFDIDELEALVKRLLRAPS